MNPNSFTNEGLLHKLSDNVYAIIGHESESNTGFLLYENGVVVIDNDIRTVNQQLHQIRQTTIKQIQYVVNTHHSFDHCSANQIFAEKGAIIISSHKCIECLAESATTPKGRGS